MCGRSAARRRPYRLPVSSCSRLCCRRRRRRRRTRAMGDRRMPLDARNARAQRTVATRRAFTASLSTCSTASESSQPRQASVMLWPKASWPGRLAGTELLAPPQMRIRPSRRRSAARLGPPARPRRARTSSCRRYCFVAVGVAQSTISRWGNWAAPAPHRRRDAGRVIVRRPPPRRIRWQSWFPRVLTMATWPFLWTDRKWCWCAAATIASSAILHVAVGAVLEADRRRQPGRQFAVDLRFGGARADRPPADQVADVLRRDGVQELRPGRHAPAGGCRSSRSRAMRRPSLMRKVPSR